MKLVSHMETRRPCNRLTGWFLELVTPSNLATTLGPACLRNPYVPPHKPCPYSALLCNTIPARLSGTCRSACREKQKHVSRTHFTPIPASPGSSAWPTWEVPTTSGVDPCLIKPRRVYLLVPFARKGLMMSNALKCIK